MDSLTQIVLGASVAAAVVPAAHRRAALLAGAALGTLPDLDGIPVALMEAMAVGCPVVSTRVSGIPELIEHESSGLLVNERDPHAMADAIERLLVDGLLGERLAIQARRRIEQEFDAHKEGRKLLGYMEEIANAG